MSLLATVNGRGLLASRPAAASANEGYLYYATDSGTGSLFRSNGSSWDAYSSGGLADQGAFTYLDGTVAAAPSTPASGKLRVYAKTGKVLAVKDDAGVETVLGAAGAGGGGLVFLEGHAASASSSLDFTSFISSTYDAYVIIGDEIAPATNGADLYVRFGSGGTPTYDTGNNYEWAQRALTTAAADASGAGSTGAAKLLNTLSNNAGYGFGSFYLLATGLRSTSHRKTLHGHIQYVSSAPTSVFGVWGCQWTDTANAATALRFIMSSGNIASGTIRIYGVVNS